MAESGEWLRARGIGRERFAGYVAEFLGGIGYTVDRTESTEPPSSRVQATLTRMNPAVPDSGKQIEIRFYPTSGGAAAVWIAPSSVPVEERPRLDRLVRELVAHLERSVSTESHGTAKVSKAPTSRLPWEPAPGAAATAATAAETA